MTDSLFYDVARRVTFPTGSSIIPAQNAFRQELEHDVKPYTSDNSYQLEAVMVSGAASPDGPYAGNQLLSRRRAEAVLDLVRATLDMPEARLVRRKDVAEDYGLLLRLMQRRNDSDYRRVAQVISRYAPEQPQQIKTDLMALDNRGVWNRLVRDYFPEMRAARVVLFFRQKPTPKAPQPVRDSLKEAEPVSPPAHVPEPAQPAAALQTPEKMPRREYLSVKTNLLFDFAYVPGYDRFCPVPNIAVEYYPLHGHFTFGASLDFPWWQDYDAHKYFQIRNYQIETRYYLRSGDVRLRGYGQGMAFEGFYAQAYAHVGLYGICFDADRGWEGEAAGAGLGFGWVKPLSKNGRWRLEIGAQVGIFFSKYDPYQYESPIYPDLHDDLYYYKWKLSGNLFKRRQYRYTWVGPTRVGVTLTYDLLYRRNAKKGVSFKKWEKTR